MPNYGFPFLGSNLSCIGHIDFMVKSAIAKVIAISIIFKKFIHNCNSCGFIIKRSVVHNLNAQALINLKEFGFGTVTISGLFFGM